MLDERRVGLGGRARHRRLRPPADRHLAPVAARRAGCTAAEAWSEAVAGGAWGRRRCEARRADAPGGRHGALAGVPGVVRAPGRAASGRSARASAASRRRRSWRSPATCTTPTWSRSATRAGPGCARTSGRPSARPTATRSRRASATRSGSAWSRPFELVHARARAAGRGARPRDRLADGRRRAVVRQPGGHADVDGRDMDMRLDKAVPWTRRRARLECVLEHRLTPTARRARR